MLIVLKSKARNLSIKLLEINRKSIIKHINQLTLENMSYLCVWPWQTHLRYIGNLYVYYFYRNKNTANRIENHSHLFCNDCPISPLNSSVFNTFYCGSALKFSYSIHIFHSNSYLTESKYHCPATLHAIRCVRISNSEMVSDKVFSKVCVTVCIPSTGHFLCISTRKVFEICRPVLWCFFKLI